LNSNFWDDRYSDKNYIYGKEPNLYFKSKIDNLSPGKILLPAEGEGRNAVYAAKLGWDVYCFDISIQGKLKAEQLAKENNVKINYSIEDANLINYDFEFDMIAFVFNHFGVAKENNIYSKLAGFLKAGACVVLECFSKEQLEYQSIYNSGGPGDIDLLFDFDVINKIFPNFEVLELTKQIKELSEGDYHFGLSSVIDFYGIKK